ncbi:hypothetical protein KIPB_008299, partial [Kipferlia bialata]|eukprot:g8299.t1
MPYNLKRHVHEDIYALQQRYPYEKVYNVQALREPNFPSVVASVGLPRQYVSIGPNRELGIYPEYALVMVRDPSTHALRVEECVRLPQELSLDIEERERQGEKAQYLHVGGYVVGVKTVFECALYLLDLGSLQWVSVKPTPAYRGQTRFFNWPRPRHDPVCTVVEDRLVLFGGRELWWEPNGCNPSDAMRYYTDTWSYDPDTHVWTQQGDCPPHMHVWDVCTPLVVSTGETAYVPNAWRNGYDTFSFRCGWMTGREEDKLHFYCMTVKMAGRQIMLLRETVEEHVHLYDTITGELIAAGRYAVKGQRRVAVDEGQPCMVCAGQASGVSLFFNPSWLYPHYSMGWCSRVKVSKQEYEGKGRGCVDVWYGQGCMVFKDVGITMFSNPSWLYPHHSLGWCSRLRMRRGEPG